MSRPPKSDYVELRCSSAFSFLQAASTPEDLVETAATLECPTLALADRSGLYGIPRFHQAATRAGLRAIVGARMVVADDHPRSAGRARAKSAKLLPDPATKARAKSARFLPDPATSLLPDPATSPSPASARHPTTTELLLLVESQQGYRNLSRLLTVAHEKGAKGECWATWDEVESHAGDLTCLVRGNGSLSPARLDRALGVFGHARVAVDVSRHLDRGVEGETRYAAAVAEAAHATVVASGDVRHARPQDRPLCDVLHCLGAKTTLDAAGRMLAPNAERHLHAPEEMAARFADRPDWVRASRAIAERCAFEMGDLGYRFPTFPVASGETQESALRTLTMQGARERYGAPLPEKARRQIEHELGVIEKLDLAGYFLIVWDISRFARERRMLAQGRGSAANSAVCYALGITAVDPVGMELLFERFLSEERGEWPDIDIDLPSGDKREEAIQYVFERYGHRGAAMTATVISYRTRLAVREMGKALGVELDTLDRLSKLIARLDLREDLEETHAMLREGGIDPSAPRVQLLLGLTEQVRGLPRHLGQHTGGIVIAAGRLDEVVPIEPAAMENRRVIQWDKDDCADLGIIKIDLLGLGMLNALEYTIDLARRHEGVDIDLAQLPPDDPDTYAMIRAADTMGTFQIESRAQMATLPRMKPERFYDLVVEVAIIRPGPIVGKMVNPYLERRNGREPVTYPHPSLEPILKRTLGVPLFQEQLLRLAMTAAGFTGGEAEELRRAMGFKRSVERMDKIEARLRAGMQERGIEGEVQDTIVRGITSFALYGFPESHAASFALIAYASAYLKCHHPAAFLTGLLNAWPMGFYSPASLVKDAQRHGVELRPIDAGHSDWLSALELSKPKPAVRLGLRFVDGLRKEAGLAIEAARAERPFAHVADLAQRAGLKHRELLALAELGALASIDPDSSTRRQALWQVAALERDPKSLFAGTAPPRARSPLPEMSPLEETLADYRTSGISTGPHVMAHLRAGLRERGVLSARDLRDVPDGQTVRTAGHVIVRQRPGSAKGLCFLTLEDETGTANAMLTPQVFKRFRVPLHTSTLVEIAGPLQSVDGVIHVRVAHVAALGRQGTALPDSHDYR